MIDSGDSCVVPASAYWLEYQSVSELYLRDSCPSPFPRGVRAQMSCKKTEKLYFVLLQILFPRFFILLWMMVLWVSSIFSQNIFLAKIKNDVCVCVCCVSLSLCACVYVCVWECMHMPCVSLPMCAHLKADIRMYFPFASFSPKNIFINS